MDGATPTAFRSRFRDDLVPTLKQLHRTQPDAVLRWFYRGQFWESPEAEQEAFLARRRMASARGGDWRPGGQHKDPRAKYQKTRDQKRAQFKRRTWGPRPSDAAGPAGPGDSSRSGPGSDRPKAWGGKKPYKSKTWGGPKGSSGPRGPKPHFGSKDQRRPYGKPGNRRPGGPRGPRGPRGPGRGGKV